MDKVFPPQVMDSRTFILPVWVCFVRLFSLLTPTFIIEPKFVIRRNRASISSSIFKSSISVISFLYCYIRSDCDYTMEFYDTEGEARPSQDGLRGLFKQFPDERSLEKVPKRPHEAAICALCLQTHPFDEICPAS